MKRTFLAALFVLVCLGHISAHEVWIEETKDKELIVRFAEYGEDYEKSPGHLDGLAQPLAWTFGADGKPAPFDVQKRADGFLLAASSADKGALAEAVYAVMKRGEGPARKPIFYARWHHADAGVAKPALTFDIVPLEKAGDVQVFFRNKPVPDVKITVIDPDHQEAELTTDKEGRATFTPGKPGNYLLYCSHQRETQDGFFGGVAYDTVSHNASLFWKQK